MSRKLWITLGIVLVAVVAIASVAHMSSGEPVRTAVVTVEPISETVDEQGVTRLPLTYLVTMPQTGRIEAITLREDMPVRAGEVVARIVPKDLQLDIDLARASVERLDASIRENNDTTVEETALKQAEQFANSMQSSVLAAEARVDAGKAKLDYAQKNLARVESLRETMAQTQAELDSAILLNAESDVEYRQDKLVHSAMEAIRLATDLMPTMVRQYIERKQLTEDVLLKQKAEAAVQLQRVELDQQRGTMVSPIDGVVLKRYVENERYLTAGTSLLELGRLEELEVEADLLSLDVVDVKEGDRVEIYGPAVGETPARGQVERIYPAGFTKISSLGVEQQRVKIIIRIDDEDRRRLIEERHVGVGYRVRARIFTQSKDAATTIPRAALFRGDDGQWQVFAVEGRQAIIRDVEVGLMNDQRAEIVSGLDASARVIVAPENTLTDGARVTWEE